MNNLRISTDELIQELELENKSLLKGEEKTYQLSKEDLENIIDKVGQRISSVYKADHRQGSGDEDDLMLGRVIDELSEEFNSKKNKNKLKM